jgi:hypothetical protein
MEILLRKEEELLQSVEEPTPGHMKTLVTPDAISLDAGGVVPISAFADMWSQIKITGHTTSDMRVIPLSEDAALVTYKLMQSGSIAGTPIAPELYATTAWTRRSGQWLAAFHQEVAVGALAT